MIRKREEVLKLSPFQREKGRLYFVDKEGDLASFHRATGHYPEKCLTRKELKLGIKKEKGWWYYPKQNSILRLRQCQHA